MRSSVIHKLAYSWAGWPKTGSFPQKPGADFLSAIDSAWKSDGIERIADKWTPQQIQLTFRAQPEIAPTTVTARIKGRLDHALRKTGWTGGFSRNFALRGIGENTTGTVLAYIATQLDRADLADPRYVRQLAAAAWDNPLFDPADPHPSAHGLYWYDLHVVAVTDSRWGVSKEDFLTRIRETVLTWSAGLDVKKEPGAAAPGLRSLAVMPDHIHLALRGPVERSPVELAEDLRGHLNRAAGCRLFSDNLYVGTFSEYPLGAVLRKKERE